VISAAYRVGGAAYRVIYAAYRVGGAGALRR
jgi:hypothetical protein